MAHEKLRYELPNEILNPRRLYVAIAELSCQADDQWHLVRDAVRSAVSVPSSEIKGQDVPAVCRYGCPA